MFVHMAIIYVLVNNIMKDSSSCCVVSACGPVYGLMYPIVMGRSSCCVVCVCMWSCLWANVSHSDGPFFLFCCVVSVCGPVYGLMYPIVMGRSSCCVVLCLYVVLSMG
jgi:hypothetical protein